MDFKKLVSDVSTSLNRAVQFTEERLGTSERTEYDAQFDSLCQRADRLNEGCERLIRACEAYLVPDPATRVENFVTDKLSTRKRERITPSEDLATVMCQMANEIGPATQYGALLMKTSESQRQFGILEKDLAQQVEQQFLTPIKKYVQEDFKKIRSERDVLDTKRLDLDSAKNRLKKAKQGTTAQTQTLDVVEKEAEAAQIAFDRQLETTRLLLEGVASVYTLHVRSLGNLLRAEQQYHQKCLAAVGDVVAQLGNADVDVTYATPRDGNA